MQLFCGKNHTPYLQLHILAQTFSYRNYEPSQHSLYAELGFTYFTV